MFCDVTFKLVDAYADLLHSISVANSYRVVFQSVEVDGYAHRGADFVLSAIAFADTACFVVIYAEFFCKVLINFRRFVAEFLLQRQYRNFTPKDGSIT